MNEIKFRAWDKLEKKMINWNNLMEGFNLSILSGHTFDSDEYIIMQYTELDDEKGQEIYVGDIIQDVKNWTVYRSISGEYRLTYAIGSGDKSLYPIADVVTVIGNIYENPEMIGK